jgi:hypothetical protein
MENSVLNVNVSCVPNYYTKQPTAPVNLLTWLTSKKYAHAIDRIRKTADAAERHRLKSELPAITPSGLFTAINERSMLHHSGFIQFDIDKIGGDSFRIRGLKNQLSNISNIAYCGVSAGGNGLWGLIRIAYPDRHLQHWQYMKSIFQRYDITLDEAPKNIASLRGYSYDPEGYFNHNAPMLVKHTPLPVVAAGSPIAYNDNHSIIKRLIAQLVESEIDITEGYNNWFALGCCIAANFGEGGRILFHNISQYNGKYDIETCNKKYDDCRKAANDTGIGFLVKRCKEYKVVLGR